MNDRRRYVIWWLRLSLEDTSEQLTDLASNSMSTESVEVGGVRHSVERMEVCDRALVGPWDHLVISWGLAMLVIDMMMACYNGD